MGLEPEKLIAYCLMYVFGVGLFVVIMNNMPSTATMAAWLFTGHEVVAAIFPVVPYLFLIGMILTPSYFLIKELG
jgi:hypothetical protein